MAKPSVPKKPQVKDAVNIMEVLNSCIKNWYWFVISVAICVLFASYQMMKITPRYASSIVVLFKDDTTAPSGTDDANSIDLSQLGFFTNNGKIADEIITLRSVPMVTEAVERLDLNNAYYIKEDLHNKLLYKTSPINVQKQFTKGENDEDDGSYSFVVKLTSPDTYEISNMPGMEKGDKLRAHIGKVIQTPLGRFKVTLTDNFNEKYIDEPITYTHTSPVNVAAGIAGGITYSLVEFSNNILNIGVTDVDPQRAADILNTLLEVYNEHWITEKNIVAKSTSEFIDERLDAIEKELGDVDNNISSFKSANLLSDGATVATQAMSQLAESQARKVELQNRISLVKYIRREVQNASLESTLPNPAGIEGTTVESQLGEYNKIVMERNRMLATSSENNPIVQDRTNTLNVLRGNMVSSIDNLLLSLNTQLRSLETQEAKSTSDLARSPSQSKYLLSVERKQKVKESLYLYLLQKREENELTQAFTAYNTRIINKAGYGGRIGMDNSNSTLIAVGVGLVIPLVIIFLIKNLDTKVRSRRDLKNLNVPFMGELPFVGKKPSFIKKVLKKVENTATKRPILVKARNRNAINEAFRVVRSNLDFINNSTGAGSSEEPVRVIMVTSMYAGSGKTFFSLNFASALAAKGKKAILIDLDMRKGSMSNVVGPGRKGITNYIIGQASLSDIIVHNVEGNEGLDIIPIGAIPPNPSEMLYSSKFDELIEKLKEEYAYVLIDCPPVDVVADTRIINRLADMTIFVIRAGLFEKSDIQRLNELYDSKRFKNLVMVLNGIDKEAAYYGRRKYAKNYAGYIHQDPE